MAVSEQTPYKEHTANGSTNSFPLDFDCDNQDHLIVLVDDYEPAVGTWSLSDGAVVFNTAPENNKKITIKRNTPFRRDTNYKSYDNSFRPDPMNRDLDLIWWKLQELGHRDQVIWLTLFKEIADRVNGDANLQNQINTIDELLTNLQQNVNKNTSDIAQLVNDLSKEITDRITADQSLKDLFLSMMDEAINQGTINALAITHVDSLEALDAISNIWEGRTVYVKGIGNYQYISLTSSWEKTYQSSGLIFDANGQTQEEINKYTISEYNSVAKLRSFKPRRDGDTAYITGINSGSPLGSGKWYYDASDTTSTDNGWFIIVTNEGKRLKRVDLDREFTLAWAAIPNDGDLALPWQQAAIYVFGQASLKSRLGGVPAIKIPAGKYKMSAGVVLPTVIRTVSEGLVDIDCSDWIDISKGEKVIQIRNTTSIVYNRLGFTQQSAYLNGLFGGIHITGPGKDVAAITGVWVGSLAAGFTPMRGSILSNVSITNFHKGLEWGRYDNYLGRYFQCQFEGNNYNLHTSHSTQTNSGERNSFVDCVFGIAGMNHVYHNTNACDINFENCSFDYCYDSIIYSGAQASYSTLKFTDCHFESYTNYLVDGVEAAYKNILITNATFIKSGGSIGNSASKPLFSPAITNSGNTCKFIVKGYELRTTVQAWGRDIFSTGALNFRNNNNITMSGCTKDPWGHIPSLRSIKNMGYDMSGEIEGKTGQAGSEFTNFTLGTVFGSTALVNANKQIVLTKNQENNSFTLAGKVVPISVNSNYGVICSFVRNASRGGKQVNYIDYYDANDVLLSTSTGFSVDLDTYWTNTAAPNYASGDTRDICTQMQVMSTPPHGAVKARLRVGVSSFTTGLAITSAALVEFPA